MILFDSSPTKTIRMRAWNRLRRIGLSLLAMSSVCVAQAQNNNLSAGDIAFVGYTADPDGTTVDQFSIVVTRVGGIPEGSIIYFTDNGWSNSSANFVGSIIATNEGYLRWTIPAGGLPQGVEVRFASTGVGTGITWTATSGTVTTPSTFPITLATSGDQVLAFQTGSTAGPAGAFNGVPIRFLAGVHANTSSFGGTSASNWDISDPIVGAIRPDGPANRSNLPPGLTGGTTAVYLNSAGGTSVNSGVTSGATPSESDAAKFQCTGLPSASVSTVLSLINNPSNWAYADASFGTGVSSNCSFGSPLPVTLLRFTAQLIGRNEVSLQWTVAEQLNIQRYRIEWSVDGRHFTTGGLQPASNLVNDQYRFVHQPNTRGTLYYRLRIEERDGSFSYSPTALITIRNNGQTWAIYPNPARHQATLQQGDRVITGEAVLIGMHGQVVRKFIINQAQQPLNLEGLASGVYTLRLTDGSTQKFIKQ